MQMFTPPDVSTRAEQRVEENLMNEKHVLYKPIIAFAFHLIFSNQQQLLTEVV